MKFTPAKEQIEIDEVMTCAVREDIGLFSVAIFVKVKSKWEERSFSRNMTASYAATMDMIGSKFEFQCHVMSQTGFGSKSVFRTMLVKRKFAGECSGPFHARLSFVSEKDGRLYLFCARMNN